MLLKLGSKKYKLEYPREYNDYINYTLRLQEKINKKIVSLSGFRSIRKILKKMLKVHFPDREGIDRLLLRIKKINFNIPLE